MTIEQVKNLRTGDQIFWNDPDDGDCSRHYVIQSITIKEWSQNRCVVAIQDIDGSYLECFASELA